ncbi:hypothetical protein [Epilithonimonas zeae]|uniref:hypothetical protein n=1 Tax=Epilithonimonas zeae TaxID=1416779 RepID=UPI00200D7316|nr:hypothetical protein [Epilithonimonas zeae]UQB67573.1 hypothetical protein KI430_11030 [Epilithonimonas zeae]
MKTNIITSLLLIAAATGIKSQVAIGKTSVTNNSVSLEFSDAENKGMILPYIENKSAITENGSVIFDNTDHKVKYLKDNSWFDLSVDTTGKSDIAIQTSKTELSTAKTTIGTNTAMDSNGILVLSDANKAMILPRVASPHLNIINPAPGMMVYDTTKKQLAVYNGTVWSFWKP